MNTKLLPRKVTHPYPDFYYEIKCDSVESRNSILANRPQGLLAMAWGEEETWIIFHHVSEESVREYLQAQNFTGEVQVLRYLLR